MTDSALTKQQATMVELGPMQLMQQALASGTSPEVIRELVALQQSVERFNWEREERQWKDERGRPRRERLIPCNALSTFEDFQHRGGHRQATARVSEGAL